jgi:3-methyladenine DNA glycosylase/8-oxoguanine DNA glycosylase
MPTITIKPPADYDLARDVCSYGYFLLAPNYWDVRKRVFRRVMTIGGEAEPVVVSQPLGRGGALKVTLARTLRSAEKTELISGLTRMLRLDETQEHLAEFHRVDPRFASSGRGRLFRSPTLFEDVIKTVTSCNVTWPSTVQMNRRLCEVLGSKVEGESHPTQTHGFPSAAKLARTRPETLRARCRVGYRDARMVELAKLFCTSPARGGIDVQMLEDPATGDDAVFTYLKELPGIGPYAAANIMQLMGRYKRLPLDTESVRHGKVVMGLKGSSASIMKKVHAHFLPFGAHAFRSYWFEIWEYYQQRHGPSDQWERDSTGKLFTAAKLAQK